MALYPNTPLPSSVSAPAIIDPVLRYSADSGIEIRRIRTSRPRRRYTLDYLGKTTEEMHYLRDFLMVHRLGVTPFEFLHPTASDDVTFSNTTPVVLTINTHGLITGQWVFIGNAPTPLNGLWTVTRINHYQLSLNGSVASGTGTGGLSVVVYLPTAVAMFDQDTWNSPTKLVGPERLGTSLVRSGYFSWSVVVEEVF